jgi:hypothetical protein
MESLFLKCTGYVFSLTTGYNLTKDVVSSDKLITVFEYQKLDWKPEKKDVLRVERLNRLKEQSYP